MSQTKCLLQAFDTIRNDAALDPEVREQVSDTMEQVIRRYQGDEARQLVAANQLLRTESRQLFEAQISKRANELRREQLLIELGTLPPEEQLTALRNMIEYDAGYRQQDTVHVSGAAKAETEYALGRLREVWNNLSQMTLYGVSRDTQFSRTFMRELHGADTGDALAKRLVGQFREVMDPYLERLRNAGVYVERRPDWGPQTHAVSRITGDFENWQQFLRENLDPRFHPDPDATAEAVYSRLMTRETDEQIRPTITMARQIKFRSPEAHADYAVRFGEENISELLMRHVESTARHTVLAERLGPTPAANVRFVAQQIRSSVKPEAGRLARRIETLERQERQAGTKERAAQLREERVELERQLAATETGIRGGRFNIGGDAGRTAVHLTESVQGRFASPVNQTAANAAAAGRNLMTTSMLGFVAIAASLSDSLIGLFRARFHTGGFASGVGSDMRALFDVVGDRNARAYLQELGVFDHAIRSSMVDRFSTAFGAIETATGRMGSTSAAERARSFTAKTAIATQRLSLSHTVDRGLRSAFMLMASRQLMQNLNARNWGDLHPRVRRMYEANAFDESFYRRLQRVALEREGVGGVEVNNLAPADFERVMSLLHRESDAAVIRPGHFDRLLLAGFARPGTLSGEVSVGATQFLSWPVAMFRNAVMTEARAGGAGQLGFYAALIASGVLTVQAYALLRNEPTYEWDSPTLWTRSIARSGLLTPVGEAIMQAAHPGQTMPGSVLEGPLLSTGSRVLSNMGAGTMDLIDGEGERAARRALQTIQATAVPNIFWTEWAATSRAMDYAIEQLDPQYYRERERRWRQEGRDL